MQQSPNRFRRGEDATHAIQLSGMYGWRLDGHSVVGEKEKEVRKPLYTTSLMTNQGTYVEMICRRNENRAKRKPARIGRTVGRTGATDPPADTYERMDANDACLHRTFI